MSEEAVLSVQDGGFRLELPQQTALVLADLNARLDEEAVLHPEWVKVVEVFSEDGTKRISFGPDGFRFKGLDLRELEHVIIDPITVRQAAKLLDLSPSTVSRWAKEGLIRCRETAEVKPSPILVSRAEILTFDPPRKGPGKRSRPDSVSEAAA